MNNYIESIILLWIEDVVDVKKFPQSIYFPCNTLSSVHHWPVDRCLDLLDGAHVRGLDERPAAALELPDHLALRQHVAQVLRLHQLHERVDLHVLEEPAKTIQIIFDLEPNHFENLPNFRTIFVC